MIRHSTTIRPSDFQSGMWWFPGLVGLVVVVGTLTFVWPKVQSILDLQQQIESNQEKLVQMEKKKGLLDEIDEAKLEENMILATTALPDSKPYFEVLNQLQVVAVSTGVILGDYDLNPGLVSSQSTQKVGDKGVSLQTKLTVKGTSDQLNSFFDQLNSTMPLFAVTSVTISQEQAELRNASLAIEIYYQPRAQQKKASTTDPLPELSQKSKETLETLASYKVNEPDVYNASVVDFNREDIFNY